MHACASGGLARRGAAPACSPKQAEIQALVESETVSASLGPFWMMSAGHPREQSAAGRVESASERSRWVPGGAVGRGGVRPAGASSAEQRAPQ